MNTELKMIRNHLTEANSKVREKENRKKEAKDYTEFLGLIGIKTVE